MPIPGEELSHFYKSFRDDIVKDGKGLSGEERKKIIINFRKGGQ